MAEKQQVKRKAKTVKKTQVRKKNQHTQQSRRTQKKLLFHLEHGVKHPYATKTVSSKAVRFSSPKIVQLLLKAYIEAKAKDIMKTLLTDVYYSIAIEVQSLSQKTLPFIRCPDVQTALKKAMTELASYTAEPISSA